MEIALERKECVAIGVTGEVATFAELYDHYFPQVYAYVRYRVEDRMIAEDLTAVVFERALAKIGLYRADEASFATWLFRIARHAVIDHYRKQKVRPQVALEEVSLLVAPEPTPEAWLLREEEFQWLRAHLRELSDREQEMIALKFATGLTNRRIAQVTGLSESNVGVIVHRAIRKLRRKFEEDEDERRV